MHGHGDDRVAVQIGDENLNFTHVHLSDPVPTGRQLIKAAGKHPVDDHAVLAIMPDNALEILRLDETFDLRRHGVERFLVCRSDTLYRFFIDGQDQQWPVRRITGVVLKTLAGVDPVAFEVFLVIPGADDIRVADHELFDLAREGVEHFQTVARKAPSEHGITLRVVVNGTETELKVHPETPLAQVRTEALQKSGNVGRPEDEWQLKDEHGNPYDLTKTVAGVGLHDGDLVWLSLNAGVAGA
jgi:hypothetical protein